MDEEGVEGAVIETLGQLGRLKGVGTKTVENMRSGLVLEQRV
jgi:DNA uptake protein ComE-like DNA-binding protein